MDRNLMLVDIANDFHKRTLSVSPTEYGGSLADMVEDELIAVLNRHVEGGRIKWMGLGVGYGFANE